MQVRALVGWGPPDSIQGGIFRRIRKIVCPSTWNNSAPTGRICMKFDIRVFFEKLSRKLEFN